MGSLTSSDEESRLTLNSYDKDTKTFVAPIVESLHYEGSYHFKPACFESPLINTVSPTCTHGSPAIQTAQEIMASLTNSKVTLADDDNSHRVYTIVPVHLPEFENYCDGTSKCTLEAVTVSQNVNSYGDEWLDAGLW